MTPPPPTGTATSTTGSTLPRVLAVGALALAAIVVAVVVLTGGPKTEYKLVFQNAGQLVKGDQVQVGGRPVGSITDIKLTDDNQAEVAIEMNEFAPLHEGTRATIRAASLSGIANRYISLDLGPNSAPELKSGATIPTSRTTTPVDLDQLFNTLDPRTREALQQVVQGSAEQYQGKGRQVNESARYFNPFVSTTDRLVREALSDQGSLTDFIVSSSRLVTALAERRDDLVGLVSNANATAGAIAQENSALAASLDLLPTTLRRGNTTFVNLRATLDDLDVLVNESKPVAPQLAPFFRQLRPLVRAARPTVRDLRRLVRQAGPNNDLTDVLRKAPRLARVATPTFRRAVLTLRRSQPVIEFIRPYAPEAIMWLRDFGQGGSSYDANGHYARIAPMFNAFSFNPATNLLSAIDPAARTGLYGTEFLGNNLDRCPGAASQPPPDGSAPFTDGGVLDCDPSIVPPGP